jgi:nitrogen fixation protein NifT|nr:putative nitrogen fixation protein NifT [Rhizomicrobium palustre]
MLRKVGEDLSVYIAKKDLEEKVVELETPGMWGGKVKLANGWVFQLPEMAADTRLPISVEARRLES